MLSPSLTERLSRLAHLPAVRTAAQALLIVVAYYLGEALGLLTVIQPQNIATIWPPSGILVAGLLLTPRRTWGWTLLAVFLSDALANLISGSNLPISLGFAATNSLDGLIVAAFLIYFAGPEITFDKPRDVIGLAVAAIFVNAIISLAGAAVFAAQSGEVNFWAVWRIWAVADGVGLLLVTPLLVIWRHSGFSSISAASTKRWGERLALTMAAVVITFTAFWIFPNSTYLLYPLMVWSAIRFRTRGAVLTSALVAAIANGDLVRDYVMYHNTQKPLHDNFFEFQIFVGIFAFSTLLLATYVDAYKQSLAALNDSISEHNTMLDTSIDTFWVADAKGQFLEVNQAFCKLLGYSREELLSMKIPDIEVQETANEVRRHIEHVIVNGSDRFETRHKTREGRIVDMSMSVTYLPLAGERLYIFGQDITEKKRAEIGLSESRILLERLFASLDEAIFIMNPTTREIQKCNLAAERILGYTSAQMVGQSTEFLHINQKAFKDFGQRMLKSLEKGQPFHTEFRMKRKDGTEFPTDHYVSEIVDEAGKRIALVSVMRDITERQSAEQALRESEEKFRLLSEQSLMGICVMQDNKIKYANHAMEIINSCPVEEMLNWEAVDFSKLIHPDDLEFAVTQARKKQLGMSDVVSGYQYRLLTPDGDIKWVDQYSKTVMYEGRPADLITLVDITERKLGEVARHESEQRFHAIFDRAPIGIALVDTRTGKFMDINAAYCDIVGRTRDEMLSLDFQTITHPDDLQPDLDNMQQLVAGKIDQFTMEKRYIRPDGSVVWVNLSVVPLWAEGEAKNFHLGMVQDITERKQAEAELHKSETRLSQAMNLARIGIWDWDYTTDRVEWLGNMFNIYGITPEAFTGNGSDYIDFTREDYRKAQQENIKIAFEKGVTEDDLRQGTYVGDAPKELCIVRPDGSEVYTLGDAVSIIDEAGKPVRMLGVTLDITDLKRTEENLYKLSSAVEQSPASVVITNLKGNIEYVNQKFVEVTGYSAAEVLGKNPRILKSGHTAEPEYKELWETITAGSVWRGEFYNKKKSGELYWELASISPVYNTEGKITHFLAVKEDITERKRIEHEIQQSEAELKQAQAVAHVGSWKWHIKTNLLEWSDEMYHIFGIEKEAFTGSLPDVIAQTIHPDDRAAVDAANSSVANESKSVPMSYRIVWPDRSVHVVWAEGGILEVDEAGNPVALSGIVQDITERSLVAKALQESEERFRTLVMSMDDVIFTLDTEQRHIGVFGDWVNKIGLTPDYFLGRSAAEIFGSEAGAVHQEANQQALAGHVTIYEWDSEFSGEPQYYQTVLSPILDDHGEIQGLVGVGRNITGLRMAEKLAHHRANQLALLNQIGHQITASLDSQSILDEAVRLIHEAFNYDKVSIFLLDPAAGDLILRARMGERFDSFPEVFRMAIEKGIVGETFRTGNPIISNDVHSDPRYFNPFGDSLIRSELSIPIRTGEKVIGVLDMQSHESREFTETDMTVLGTLADQLAIAIHNADLYALERRERTLAQVFQKITNAISEFDDLEEVLNRLVSLLDEVIHYDQISVMLLKDLKLQPIAIKGNGHQNGAENSGSLHPLLDQSMTDNHPLILRPDKRANPEWLWLPAFEAKTTTWIGMPLVSTGVVFGYICVSTHRPGGYQPDEVQAVHTFAGQMLLAVNRSSLLGELKQTQTHLTRMARLSAAGEISAGVAHQINNPLTAVIAQAHLLIKESKPDTKPYHRAEEIRHAAYQAANVVQRMLDFARINPYDFQPVDVNETINEAVALIRAQVEPTGAHLSLSLSPGLPAMIGSKEHLEDVWLNMILNARDAMISAADPEIKITTELASDGKMIMVKIADNGQGISPEKQPKIFDPFFTTKTHGTGLGLSICQDVVNQHNGTIVFQSESGKGTVFYISLPVAENGVKAEVKILGSYSSTVGHK